jgi:amino acid permease
MQPGVCRKGLEEVMNAVFRTAFISVENSYFYASG